MSQSRLESGIETAFNVVIGFSLNYALNIVLIPQFATDGQGHPAHLSAIANWWMGCTYTVVSVVRSYGLRRFFNAGLQRQAQRLAAWLRWLGSSLALSLSLFVFLFTPEPHHDHDLV